MALPAQIFDTISQTEHHYWSQFSQFLQWIKYNYPLF